MLDEAEDSFQSDYNNPLGRVFGKKEGSKAWRNSLLEGKEKPVTWISNQVGHINPAYRPTEHGDGLAAEGRRRRRGSHA